MVVKLVGLKRAGNLRRKPVGDAVVRLGGLGGNVRRRDHDVGAVRAKQVDLLARHLIGHHENAAVAANRGGHRQAAAGVAAGRLDDRSARLEQSLALGGVEHGDRGPVLYAAAGIHVFDLREYEAGRAVDDLVQPYERRVTDRLESVVAINETGRAGRFDGGCHRSRAFGVPKKFAYETVWRRVLAGDCVAALRYARVQRRLSSACSGVRERYRHRRRRSHQCAHRRRDDNDRHRPYRNDRCDRSLLDREGSERNCRLCGASERLSVGRVDRRTSSPASLFS